MNVTRGKVFTLGIKEKWPVSLSKTVSVREYCHCWVKLIRLGFKNQS